MGFDIEIGTLVYKNDQAKIKNCVSEMYLSYNWSNFSFMCIVHKDPAKCEHDSDRCVQERIWYARKDCLGRIGSDVAKRAKKALLKLRLLGFLPETKDSIDHQVYGLDDNGDFLDFDTLFGIIKKLLG